MIIRKGMRPDESVFLRFEKIALLLLCLLLALGAAAPCSAFAQEAGHKIVRVGRIGVNKNSIQADFYRDWAERNGIQPEIIEVSSSEDESLAMLDTGELDGYVTVDAFVHPENAAPVCKVGSSDFFFAVSKNRPDLLTELDAALNRIQDENRYYNQRMYEKYIRRAGANAFLSAEEVQWLSEHRTIRVGYQDNYLAFCAADKIMYANKRVRKDASC